MLNGKLSRFGKPFTASGTFMGLRPNPPQKRGRATLFLPDAMHFRVWSGNFHVTVPIWVDWMQGRVMPGLRCFVSPDDDVPRDSRGGICLREEAYEGQILVGGHTFHLDRYPRTHFLETRSRSARGTG